MDETRVDIVIIVTDFGLAIEFEGGGYYVAGLPDKNIDAYA
jgi:hypothetical protein